MRKADSCCVYEEMELLEDVFHNMRMDDMRMSRKRGCIEVHDSYGNRWRGAEVYRFIMEECLSFLPEGKLVDGLTMDEGLIAGLKRFAGNYGITIGQGISL